MAAWSASASASRTSTLPHSMSSSSLAMNGTAAGGGSSSGSSGGMRPRTAPVASSESLLSLSRSNPSITSPAATRSSARGPGARLHGHQSYFGGHKVAKPVAEAPPLARTVKRPKERGAEPTQQENEYVQLLQQQIFFLELKLNLMKKNDPFSGVPLEGPLEEVVQSLRAKYATMEAAFRKELEELKARNDEIEIINVRQARQIEHGSKAFAEQTIRHDELVEQLRVLNAEFLEAKLLHENAIARLESRAAVREREADDMSEQATAFRADSNLRYERLRAEAEDKERARRAAERRADEAERRAKELEALTLELKEEAKREMRDTDTTSALINTLKSDKLRQDQALRRLQLNVEQAEATIRKLNEQNDALLADNTKVRLELQAAESKQDAANRRQATEARGASHWSGQVADLRARVTELTTRVSNHPGEISAKQAEVDSLKAEIARANSRIEELQSRRAAEKKESKRTADDEKRTEEANALLRKEAILRQQELDAATAKAAHLQEDFDKTKLERDALNDELRVLGGRMDIMKALANINIDDFKGMASSSLRVAGAIDELASSIRAAPLPSPPAHAPHARAHRTPPLHSSSSSSSSSSSASLSAASLSSAATHGSISSDDREHKT